jgi:hypothetical protein
MMKYIAGLLLLVFGSSSLCLADEPPNQVLNKGDTAAFTGVLIPPLRANQIRLDEINLGYTTNISALKDEELSVMNTRLTNAQTENTTLSKELSSERSSSFLGNVGYFVLGSVLTGLVAYGTVHALR